VAEAWKLEFSSYVELRIDRFEVDNRTITNDQTSGEVEGLVVKSLSDHWSAGGFAQVRTSTFSNIDLQVLAAPALEYNLFPYQESSRKQLRFLSLLNVEHVNYADTTIYDKAKETLVSQSLGIAAEIQQPWGDINASAMYLQYFHDFEFNRLDFDASIDVRLFRGLELSLRGEASAIHDQLSLPRGGASEEDVLLRRRELATSFQLELSVGVAYTFGSIFNSVVNPRFGDGF
jgi:hypothetical protein